MTSPKRHHYLPQFYLRGFCRDDHLWVYDRKMKEVRRQTPINTAVEKDYYSVVNEGGEKNTEIESLLSQIEGLTKPIIEKVSNKEEISVEEKEILSLFIAFLMNRVPDFEKSVNMIQEHLIKKMAGIMFSDEKRTESVINSYENNTGNSIKVTAKVLVDFYNQGNYSIKIHRNESLRQMLDLSFSTATYFKEMDWRIFHATSGTVYVTTDNPFFVVPHPDWDPDSIWGVGGITTRGTRKVVPLSQKVCLIMFDEGDEIIHYDANSQFVSSANYEIAARTDRFLIGHDEMLVKNLSTMAKLNRSEGKGSIQII